MTEHEAQNADATSADAPNADATTNPEAAEPDSLSEGFEALPKETQDEIRRMRKQTAEYRTRAQQNEAAVTELERLKAEKQQADDDAAKKRGEWEKIATDREQQIADLNAQIAARDLAEKRRSIAKKAGLPDDMADRIRGDNDEDLESDAKELAKHLKTADAPDTDAGRRGQGGTNKKRDTNPSYTFGTRSI